MPGVGHDNYTNLQFFDAAKDEESSTACTSIKYTIHREFSLRRSLSQFEQTEPCSVIRFLRQEDEASEKQKKFLLDAAE